MSSNSTTTYPPGYLEAYDGGPIVATAIAFIAICSVSYILRFCSRMIQTRSVYRRWIWADFFMFLSLISNIGVAITVLLDVHYGAGRHIVAVSAPDVVKFAKVMFYAFPCVYLVAVVWSKLAILDLYLQVLVDKPARIACHVTAGIIVLNAIINIIVTILQCLDPFSEIWHPTPGGGHCINTHMHFVWASFANIITDIMMLFIPIPMVLNLKQSPAVKAGVLVTFLVGNVGLATSVVRLVEFYQFGWGQTEADATWTSGKILIWNTVEPGVYHLAACFMSFRPLLRWVIFESAAAPYLSSMFGKLASVSRYGRSNLSSKLNGKNSKDLDSSNSSLENASSLDSQLRSEMRDTFNVNQSLSIPPARPSLYQENPIIMPPYPPPDYMQTQDQQRQSTSSDLNSGEGTRTSRDGTRTSRDGIRDSQFSDNGRSSNGFITVRHDISIRSNVRSEQLGPTSQNDLFTPPTAASY